jgi:hypothetical protein
MELWHEVRSTVSDLTYRLRSWLPRGTQVSLCPQTANARSPLVQHVVRMHGQMTHNVVVCHDKELRATFKVIPLMLYRLTSVQSFQIVLRVGVTVLS